MYWETLPPWFWLIFYSFWVITLGASVFSLIRRRNVKLSILNLVFVITVPIITIICSIGRAEGKNEYEHFVDQLQQGEIWTLYASGGFLFILVWWYVFLFTRKKS